MSILTCRRRGIGKSLPYDAEVEYLESTGSQYIELPRGIDSSTNIRIEFMFGTNNNSRFLFGSSDGWQVNMLMLGASAGDYTLRYANTSTVINKDNVPFESRSVFVKNGTNISLGSFSIICPVYSKSIQKTFLFKGTSSGQSPMGSQNNEYMRMYSYSMSDAECTFNLIPVRIGSVGYFYDKVSDRLFEDASGVGFAVGYDK